MAIKAKTIKLAGPDTNGNYKVVATSHTLLVENGQILTRRLVKHELMTMSGPNAPTVNTVPPKFEGVNASRRIFTGEVLNTIPR